MLPDDNKDTQATADFWSQKTGRRVSVEDAREMHANLTGFFAVLLEWSAREHGCPPISEQAQKKELDNEEH